MRHEPVSPPVKRRWKAFCVVGVEHCEEIALVRTHARVRSEKLLLRMTVECTDVENEAVSAALSQCMMVERTDTGNEAVSIALSQ